MVAVLVIAIIAVSYVVSTRIHPLRKCPTCNMSGRHFGGIYKGSYRRCRRCAGRGQRDRVGTKVSSTRRMYRPPANRPGSAR